MIPRPDRRAVKVHDMRFLAHDLPCGDVHVMFAPKVLALMITRPTMHVTHVNQLGSN